METSLPLSPLVTADVDEGRELGRFLTARRSQLRPRDVGLPDGGRRRVPGLRREEVSLLAGVSPAYYTRLEQGDAGRVSDEVVGALADALQLAPAEREHLHRLTDPRAQARRERHARPPVRAALQGLIDAFTDVPALIVGRRSDILAWNRLGSAVFGDLDALPITERNWARLVFLHPAYRELFVDWGQKASDTVAQLRLDAGYHPNDPRLASLVGELSVKSSAFATLWAKHEIRERCEVTQQLDHPDVGRLELHVESFRAAGDDDTTLVTYHAGTGRSTQESLGLLSSLMPRLDGVGQNQEVLPDASSL